jgi:hypothetical protein
MLVLKVGLPLYIAAIVCGPTARLETGGKTATSRLPTTWSETGACAVPSIEKVTVPVGVPLPAVGATTAVNVTGWPTVLGLSDELSVVVVFWSEAALTVWVRGVALLVLNVALPS